LTPYGAKVFPKTDYDEFLCVNNKLWTNSSKHPKFLNFNGCCLCRKIDKQQKSKKKSKALPVTRREGPEGSEK
jgi:hypothetical protein